MSSLLSFSLRRFKMAESFENLRIRNKKSLAEPLNWLEKPEEEDKAGSF